VSNRAGQLYESRMSARLVRAVRGLAFEAKTGFEPVYLVLQTSA
jgi:hypothetical protein